METISKWYRAERRTGSRFSARSWVDCAAMDSVTRLKTAIALEKPDRPPFTLWGHTFKEEWSPKELAAVTVNGDRAQFFVDNLRALCILIEHQHLVPFVHKRLGEIISDLTAAHNDCIHAYAPCLTVLPSAASCDP